MKTKDETEKMEEQLEEIEPTTEDFMERRIHHIPFAKIVFWLNLTSRKTDFFYAKELEKFIKVSGSYTFDLLNRLVSVGILEKKYTGNIVEYHFIKNGSVPLISEYLEKAKKTLGLS